MSARIVSPREAAYNLMLVIGQAYPGCKGATQTTFVQEYLSSRPDSVELFVPDGWELLEDESEEVMQGGFCAA
ncbi:hypothetical protein ACH5AU_30750 [Streptomyces albidoflavus]